MVRRPEGSTLVLAQTWKGRAGADAAGASSPIRPQMRPGVSPVPVRTWHIVRSVPVRMWRGVSPLPGHDGAGRAGAVHQRGPDLLLVQACFEQPAVCHELHELGERHRAGAAVVVFRVPERRPLRPNFNGRRGNESKRERAEVGMGLSGTRPPQQKGV
jgi:hypothetical protein